MQLLKVMLDIENHTETDLPQNVSKEEEKDQCGAVYKCKQCDTKCSRKDNLKRHMRKKHNQETYEDEDVNKKSVCVYPGCLKSFYHKTKLIEHIAQDHLLSCQVENVVFKSMQEFEKWKQQEEASNYVYFSKSSGTAEGKNASYSYYACQKDGAARSCSNPTEATGKRYRKSGKKLVKMGTLCPARLQVKTLCSGGVLVKYIKTHSHPIKFEDTQNHPLPSEVKQLILDKIAKGMPTKDIQQTLITGGYENEEEPNRWPNRKRHLVSERLIREMKRKFKVKGTGMNCCQNV